MTRPKETIRIIIIILILLILLVISEILRKERNTGQEKETTAVSSDTIRIDLGGGMTKDYTLPSIPEGETMEFTIPSYIAEEFPRRNETMEEYINRRIEENEQSGKQYFEEERLNEDGSITDVLNQTQYDRRLEGIEELLNEIHASDKMRIEISEDFCHVIYYVEDDCTLDEWGEAYLQCGIVVQTMRSYVIMNVDFPYAFTIIRSKTGEVMYENEPGEPGHINESEWKEKLQD